MDTLAAKLNALNDAALRAALTNCCAATAWVQGMLARRPFKDDDAIFAAALEVGKELSVKDWLEAFAAHPLIGDVESLRAKYAATKALAADEQAGISGADEETLHDLAELNRDYLRRFGFIFIVCATGKNAAHMAAILRTRIGNCREEELQNAAGEQMEITLLRLQKLADSP